jgi:hypothetical protein
VAQVFSSGKVTGMGVGTETINATQENVVGTISLTITAPWTAVAPGATRPSPARRTAICMRGARTFRASWATAAPPTATRRCRSTGAGTTWRMVAVGDQFAVGIRTAAPAAPGPAPAARCGPGAITRTASSAMAPRPTARCRYRSARI